ncbi:alpha/beta hydrolase [Bradyrhizobium sp.]|uniref:alpha/beta hydrolase n=1 Tax=Bradyrhizobium sp. TaxID=376 RepID=UPI0025BE5B7A|nr:alpha/beta hydrolase [Bradyrhizobium sp.]
MIATIASGGLKAAVCGLALIGLTGSVLAILIATPLQRPPELTSISATARAVDRSGMPGLDRFHARDGTELAYRHYPARAPADGQAAIVIHGSSGSSVAVHALAKGLAERGVETWAPDIRGHGGSGTRGDIAYPGQLEDDMSDFVGEIRKANPTAPLTLIGHSSGGGFALRVAGSPIQNLFVRTVLLAPYLGYDAPSSRKDAGGWASPDIPRSLGLSVLHRLGILCCESLPTIAFAVAPNSSAILASTYSYRLMRNFGSSRDYREDLSAAARPVALFAGAADELMFPDKYREAIGPRASVTLVDGVNHMGIVSDPAAVSAIADDVVKAGGGS